MVTAALGLLFGGSIVAAQSSQTPSPTSASANGASKDANTDPGADTGGDDPEAMGGGNTTSLREDRSSRSDRAADGSQRETSRGQSGSAPNGKGMDCGAAFMPQKGESYQQALAREDRILGGLDRIRTYYSGLPKQWPGQIDTDGRPMVVSFKMNPGEVVRGKHDAHMRKWFNNAPKNQDINWVYYHEPEDNIEKGQFSGAKYRAAWRHLSKLADQANNPRLRATLTLMGYSVEKPSGRNWRDYYAGKQYIDTMAWDIYNYSNEGDGGYRKPEVLFGRALKVTKSQGLPFAVAETGSQTVKGDSGARRAQWLKSTLSYLKKNDTKWVTYFDMFINHNHGPQHYELRDKAAIRAWKSVCGG
ncbi:MAG: hypothetical protein ACRDTQ_13305 [Micromonosporaceae bacterium]